MWKYSVSIIILISLLSLSSCREMKHIVIPTNDYNLLIVPDLSNRINQEIHPKPLHDTILIDEFIGNIKALLKVRNRSINQYDIYKFDFINRGILNKGNVNVDNLLIDFGRFKNDVLKAADFKRDSLARRGLAFMNTVKGIYDYSLDNSCGADIWNYFDETIKSSLLKTDTVRLITQDGDTLLRNNKNVVVLFTDGYIENANNTKGYVLNESMIKQIRNDYLTSKSTDLDKFICSNPNYLLKRTNNQLNNVNVIILELIDRSLDRNGVALVQPTDFQIMKILWKKWLKDSGCPHVEVYQAVNSKEQVLEYLKSFMEKI